MPLENRGGLNRTARSTADFVLESYNKSMKEKSGILDGGDQTDFMVRGTSNYANNR